MKLILIHGREQQGNDPSKLRKTWIETFKKGLEKSDIILPDNIEIVFPFYGDLLDSLVRPEEIGKTIEGIIARGALPEAQLSFFYDVIMDIAVNADVSDQEIVASLEDSIVQKGPLNWGWVQAVIRAIDLKTPFGDATLRRFTYDVFIYLTFPGVRKRINDFVHSTIDSSPCVVIGHSLGSVVGYDVLGNHSTDNVIKYITIGSPLGLKSIKSKLNKPLAMPECLSSGWYNAYDERDVVALNPLDGNYFPITPEIENNNLVKNSTHNHHGITGYLNDKEVAKQIYKALILL